MEPYLEHVNITTPDIEATIRFLATAMPTWSLRGEDVENAQRRWVHFGSQHTYIAIEDRSGPADSPHEAYHHPGLNHFGIVVDDVVSLMQRMIDAGYREGTHVLGHPFRKRCYFYDEAGLEWEFVEYLSQVRAEKNDYSA